MKRGAGAFSGAPYESGEAYMRAKRQKLQQQNSTVPQESHIFDGISLYFDGYLGPEMTMIEWRDFALRQGAKVFDWLCPSVTHIIAENITDRKVELWKHKKVVRAAWLLDSYNEKRLLPWRTYQLVNGETDLQQSMQRVWGAQNQPQDDTGKGKEPKHLEDWRKQNTATAPGFIEKYYLNSRLSKISNWKQELRDFVSNYKLEKQSSRHPPPKPNQLRTIFHVDMDCFFASVAIRDRPHLRMRPVAVCHSAGLGSKASTSEIASCNYIARGFGCRNGMLLGRARELCPDLVVVPYEFDKYDACSKALYTILLENSDDVLAISCDEVFADFSSQIERRGMGETELAERVRSLILNATGCNASIGIGCNMLLARVATSRAKPDGIFLLREEEAESFLSSLPVKDLPGVGYHMCSQLERVGVTTCGDVLQKLTVTKCKSLFGDVKGAEVNWGVRFENDSEIRKFVVELAGEVETRLKRAGVRASQITVKAKKKLYDGEPHKLLGCGMCEDLSKSQPLQGMTDDAQVIARTAIVLLESLKIPPSEVRGIGIQMTKLSREAQEDSRQQNLFQMLPGIRTSPGRSKGSALSEARPVAGSSSRQVQEPASDLASIDPEFLLELPEDIRQEILMHYGSRKQHAPEQEPPQIRAARETREAPKEEDLIDDPPPDPREVRMGLRSWVANNARPERNDILEFASFIRGLVRSLRLREVYTYLGLLQTLVKGESRDWSVCLSNLQEFAKQETEKMLGAKLKIP
ncbi:deoxycytidyl transferase [Phlyctochytrium bullatum]|nr:deoxycytidyl transferase [Phlyctochytrium bullatum]